MRFILNNASVSETKGPTRRGRPVICKMEAKDDTILYIFYVNLNTFRVIQNNMISTEKSTGFETTFQLL